MMEYYSAIKKNEIMSYVATRMDLEMNILSQICSLYTESKKMIQMNLFTKQTHRHRKQRGMGSVYILIYRE